MIENAINFLSYKNQAVFNQLLDVLIKVSIPHYLYLERHIYIKNSASGFAISELLSELSLSIDYVIHKYHHTYLNLL